MEKENLSKSLKETIVHSDLSEVGIDFSEVLIDSALKEGVLKDLPIIGSLIKIWKAGVTVRDTLFVKKMLLFLNESSKLTEKQRKLIITSLEDEKYYINVGEKLLSVIDRLEDNEKAIILGKAFKEFGKGNITKEEFWNISFIIDRLPLLEILLLKDWNNNSLYHIDPVSSSLYNSVGILLFDYRAGGLIEGLSNSSITPYWNKRICEVFKNYLL